jgi:hypothetical protein
VQLGSESGAGSRREFNLGTAICEDLRMGVVRRAAREGALYAAGPTSEVVLNATGDDTGGTFVVSGRRSRTGGD